MLSTVVLNCATSICQRRRAVYGKCSTECTSRDLDPHTHRSGYSASRRDPLLSPARGRRSLSCAAELTRTSSFVSLVPIRAPFSRLGCATPKLEMDSTANFPASAARHFLACQPYRYLSAIDRLPHVGSPTHKDFSTPILNLQGPDVLACMDEQHVRECLARARYCKQLAESESDPDMRTYLLQLAADWTRAAEEEPSTEEEVSSAEDAG
jgi:hypothetical protein